MRMEIFSCGENEKYFSGMTVIDRIFFVETLPATSWGENIVK